MPDRLENQSVLADPNRLIHSKGKAYLVNPLLPSAAYMQRSAKILILI